MVEPVRLSSSTFHLSKFSTCFFAQVKKTQKKREEVVDWWTRLHVTVRDPDSDKDADESGKHENNNNNSDPVVPKLMVN